MQQTLARSDSGGETKEWRMQLQPLKPDSKKAFLTFGEVFWSASKCAGKRWLLNSISVSAPRTLCRNNRSCASLRESQRLSQGRKEKKKTSTQMSMSFSLSQFYTIFHPPTKQKQLNQTLVPLENLIAVSKWHLAKLGEKDIRLCANEWGVAHVWDL